MCIQLILWCKTKHQSYVDEFDKNAEEARQNGDGSIIEDESFVPAQSELPAKKSNALSIVIGGVLLTISGGIILWCLSGGDDSEVKNTEGSEEGSEEGIESETYERLDESDRTEKKEQKLREQEAQRLKEQKEQLAKERLKQEQAEKEQKLQKEAQQSKETADNREKEADNILTKKDINDNYLKDITSDDIAKACKQVYISQCALTAYYNECNIPKYYSTSEELLQWFTAFRNTYCQPDITNLINKLYISLHKLYNADIKDKLLATVFFKSNPYKCGDTTYNMDIVLYADKNEQEPLNPTADKVIKAMDIVKTQDMSTLNVDNTTKTHVKNVIKNILILEQYYYFQYEDHPDNKTTKRIISYLAKTDDLIQYYKTPPCDFCNKYVDIFRKDLYDSILKLYNEDDLDMKNKITEYIEQLSFKDSNGNEVVVNIELKTQDQLDANN